MSVAYEEPAKTRMRLATEVAIDQAGFTLATELVKVSLPSDSKIVGSLMGDIQSTDGEGVRTFYYLRPGSDDAVPKWIANFARISHAMGAGRVYMVVTNYNSALVESCKEVGSGLLRLTDEGVFEMVLDYASTSPRSLEEALDSRITQMRRDMERRVEMVRTDIEARHGQSAPIIATMEGDAPDRYINMFDSEYRNVDDWGAQMSRRLDGLGARSTLTEISEVEALIAAGPPSVSVGVA